MAEPSTDRRVVEARVRPPPREQPRASAGLARKQRQPLGFASRAAVDRGQRIVGVIVLGGQPRVDRAAVAELEPVARPLEILAAGQVLAEPPLAPERGPKAPGGVRVAPLRHGGRQLRVLLDRLTQRRAVGAVAVGRGAGDQRPWILAIAVEYVVFRLFFRADLTARAPAAEAAPPQDPGPRDPVPLFPLAVVAATLAGFTITSFAGVNPAWAATGGAAVLAARALARQETSPAALARAASVPFLLFVLSLGLVVQALAANGLGTAIARALPHGPALPALLAITAIAAATANLVNNLPAVPPPASRTSPAPAPAPAPARSWPSSSESTSAPT